MTSTEKKAVQAALARKAWALTQDAVNHDGAIGRQAVERLVELTYGAGILGHARIAAAMRDVADGLAVLAEYKDIVV